MGRRTSKAENTLIGAIVLIGGAVWLFQNYPVVSVILIIIFIALLVLNAKPNECELCSTELKRKVYTWKIDGKKKHLCPNCNRELEKKKSKEAISRL